MIITKQAHCDHCGASIRIDTDDQAGKVYLNQKDREIEAFKKKHEKCEVKK